MCNPGDSGLYDPGDSREWPGLIQLTVVWSDPADSWEWPVLIQLMVAWSDPGDSDLSDPADSVACLIQVSS